LFARYLFIWIEQLGAEVESIRARTRLVWPVRAEERRYIFVPEPDVADLRARVASGEFDALAGLERRLLTVGDTVLVTQGQFVGHEGVVTEVGRHRRLRVALQNCMLVAGVEQLELSH
jgi:transcription antitermination factor NusG